MKHYSKMLYMLLSISIISSINSCQKKFTEVSPAATDFTNALQGTKPNIVFIVGDDIGYEIPTINGGQSYATPNIDQLAKDGMRFTQCRATPLCSPSRFMLLTGKYNFRNYTIWGQMPQTEHTIGNMLKDAGYATCYAGKWQLDGGDQSIRGFGFDRYSVWLPFKVCPENAEGSRYKSARIYQDGGYLPDTMISNKYSEDEFAEYVMNFIDSNKTKPFFLYYSMILSHFPFSPTPDDPEYATWDTAAGSDKTFHPSMVKYMDKKIGAVINKINTLGLADNTIIFYVGDNGTPDAITSVFNGKNVTGGKSTTKEYGIHVPLICKWPGKVPVGKVNGDLIDFTDMLPTLAGAAGIPVPSNYGTLDGYSFYLQLTGATGTPRTSVFCHFKPNLCTFDTLARYAQDSIYKLYESGQFYRFKNDVTEKKPLTDSSLTRKQRQIKQNLQNVINAMHN